jgi:hypothetical protein
MPSMVKFFETTPFQVIAFAAAGVILIRSPFMFITSVAISCGLLLVGNQVMKTYQTTEQQKNITDSKEKAEMQKSSEEQNKKENTSII